MQNQVKIMSQVILLNADYTFLNIVDWKRAIKLDVLGKVEVLEYGSRLVRNAERTYKKYVPKIMKLVKFVETIYRNKVPFSKRNVMVRDDYRCVYCGKKPKKATIDHIVPRSKGGKSSFLNCVTSCKPCNDKKADQALDRSGMYLTRQPYAPSVMEFIQNRVRKLGIEKKIKDFLGICN